MSGRRRLAMKQRLGGIVFTGGCALAMIALTGSASPVRHASPASATAKLELERVLTIPGIPVGPYSDSLAIDLASKRLFATPQAAKAVAVLDLADGRVLKMLNGVGNPHGIAYDGKSMRLFVADGQSGDVKVFASPNYDLIKTIPLSPGVDMAAYDPHAQRFYVNHGGEKAGEVRSVVSVIDTSRMTKLADIVTDTKYPQGAEIDGNAHRLYIAAPDKFAVIVIDVRTRKAVRTIDMPAGRHAPWAMAVDSVRGKLYVACRDFPGRGMRGSMIAIDLASGKAEATVPIGGWADAIYIDQKRNRLYVSTGVGRVEVISLPNYQLETSAETALLAKTSLFSPELDRMFVTTPNLGATDAQIMVFRPND